MASKLKSFQPVNQRQSFDACTRSMQAIQHTLASKHATNIALIMRRRDIHGHGYVEMSKYHMRAAAPLTWADTPVSRGTSRH
jgi:hypothetical protein